MRFPIAVFTAFLSGCAAHPEPIIDPQGVNMVAYEQDLAQCESFAEVIHVEEGVARGAGLGAVVGAAAGAISGNAAEGAGYGALAGGTRSGIKNVDEKNSVVKRCLRGRGYRVLN